jgi:predicted nucleotidyltransferase
MSDVQLEIAATAARLVVEEGLNFGPAKHRAIKTLGLPGRTSLPTNDEVEAQVREYIEVFCADTQPQELRALREHARVWMERLAVFRPYLGGAVWHGWATRLSDIDLALFCDDPKSAEIALINQSLRYEVQSQIGLHGREVDVLSLHSFCRELGEDIGVHLRIYDEQDLRGALVPDAQGRRPRGDLTALRGLLAADV